MHFTMLVRLILASSIESFLSSIFMISLSAISFFMCPVLFSRISSWLSVSLRTVATTTLFYIRWYILKDVHLPHRPSALIWPWFIGIGYYPGGRDECVAKPRPITSGIQNPSVRSAAQLKNNRNPALHPLLFSSLFSRRPPIPHGNTPVKRILEFVYISGTLVCCCFSAEGSPQWQKQQESERERKRRELRRHIYSKRRKKYKINSSIV